MRAMSPSTARYASQQVRAKRYSDMPVPTYDHSNPRKFRAHCAVSPLFARRRRAIRAPMPVIIARIVGLMLALTPAIAAAVFVVSFPWARPAEKGGVTEVFMEVTSIEGATLVGARSKIAVSAMLVGPGARVKAAKSLTLPAGAPVVLAPGSYRVRLSPVDRTLKLGDVVPLALIIEASDGSRQEIGVNAEVRTRSVVDDHLHAHQH
jgi:copper(I)-binding protein